ncbi:MAG: hypothetical protein LBS70_07925 [Candidatus Accumulibacter sp.]|nr:hypothetical protein [Accumulibacter sp.]
MHACIFKHRGIACALRFRQREAEDAHDALYIAFDGITENAQAFAAKHRIRIMDPQELTALLRLPKRGKAG